MTSNEHILLLVVFAGLSAVAPTMADTVLMDHTFDGVENDTGPAFQQLYNGQGTASADPATGTITTTGIDNASIGLSASGTVDASAASAFTIEWVVSSFTGDSFNDGSGSRVKFNGWFFGVTTNTGNDGPALWNNTAESVGILMDGGTAYTDWSFVQRSGSATASNPSLNGSQPTVESFNDGFTVSLTINADDTWSASSTGLSNNISSSGSLATGTYATLAGSLVANTTIQGTQVGYVVDRVTLTTVNGPPTPTDLEVTSVTRSENTVTIEFAGGVEGQTYDLNKSTTLDFTRPDIKDTITLTGTTSGTLEDATATENKAFYRVQHQ
jgi:hypothetical protein